jgi:hypothetical protein
MFCKTSSQPFSKGEGTGRTKRKRTVKNNIYFYWARESLLKTQSNKVVIEYIL